VQRILITGAGPNGVTGRRIKEFLQNEYEILSPSSKDLDLTDSMAVDSYFESHDIDYVVHSALIAPSRGHDSTDKSKEVEDNLRMYFNLVKHTGDFKKMFYFGSGAEFDKSQPIKKFKETAYLTRIPKDKYGFIKYILNNHAINSDNIYNLRLFGTINPYEPYTRNVISNLCAKAICGMPLRLRQNCIFSFIDIDDVASFINYGITHKLMSHDFNMVSGTYSLSDIADAINKFYCDGSNEVTFETIGLNKEYSANNERLCAKFNSFTPLKWSIAKVYDKLYGIKSDINPDMIDQRWNNGNINSVDLPNVNRH